MLCAAAGIERHDVLVGPRERGVSYLTSATISAAFVRSSSAYSSVMAIERYPKHEADGIATSTENPLGHRSRGVCFSVE